MSAHVPPLLSGLELVSRPLDHAVFLLRLAWDFIESDFITFAIPNTAFGVIGAVASAALVDGPVSLRPSFLQITMRLPSILAFNIANLLVFDLANQRSPSSVVEDRINKPWRPIPQVRILMLPLEWFNNAYTLSKFALSLYGTCSRLGWMRRLISDFNIGQN